MGAEDCLQKASRINLLWYHLAISFSFHRKLSLNQMLLSAWGEQRYRCNECVGVLILVSIFGKSSWAWMSDRLTWYILDICSKRFMKSSWCWCQSQGHQWVWMRWPVNPLWNKSNWWWHHVWNCWLSKMKSDLPISPSSSPDGMRRIFCILSTLGGRQRSRGRRIRLHHKFHNSSSLCCCFTFRKSSADR